MSSGGYEKFCLYVQVNIRSLSREYVAQRHADDATRKEILERYFTENFVIPIGKRILYYVLIIVTIGIYYIVVRNLAMADFAENGPLSIFLDGIVRAAAEHLDQTSEKYDSHAQPPQSHESRKYGGFVSCEDVEVPVDAKYREEIEEALADLSAFYSPGGQAPSGQPSPTGQSPASPSGASSGATASSTAPGANPNVAAAGQTQAGAAAPAAPAAVPGQPGAGTANPTLPQIPAVLTRANLYRAKASTQKLKCLLSAHSERVCTLAITEKEVKALEKKGETTDWDYTKETILQLLREEPGFDPDGQCITEGFKIDDTDGFWHFACTLCSVIFYHRSYVWSNFGIGEIDQASGIVKWNTDPAPSLEELLKRIGQSDGSIGKGRRNRPGLEGAQKLPPKLDRWEAMAEYLKEWKDAEEWQDEPIAPQEEAPQEDELFDRELESATLEDKNRARDLLAKFIWRYPFFCAKSVYEGKGMFLYEKVEAYLPNFPPDVNDELKNLLLGGMKKCAAKFASERSFRPHQLKHILKYCALEPQYIREYDNRENDKITRREYLARLRGEVAMCKNEISETERKIKAEEENLQAILEGRT